MFKDNRRKDKFDKSKTHFTKNKNAPKTKKDIDGPRVHPAEDRGRAGGSRKENKRIAEDTLEIVEKGFYINQHEEKIKLQLDLMEAVTYTPGSTPFDISNYPKKYEDLAESDRSIYEIRQQTTLEACFEEYNKKESDNIKICALNFASAKNPGGGFLNGSSAQEESLARASALYESIYDSEMYEFNQEDNNKCLYSHYMIYSANVPVFRDDNGNILDKPYTIDILTCPAVNAKEALKRGVTTEIIDATMFSRIDRLFSVMVAHGADILILGAFGCGIFSGDYSVVSAQFMELLTEKYHGYFKKIIFALLSDADIETMKKSEYYSPYFYKTTW